MYRMKGNHDGSGSAAPAATWLLVSRPEPLLATPRPAAAISRRRFVHAVAAGVGAGLTAVGIFGLVVAAERQDAANDAGAAGWPAAESASLPADAGDAAVPRPKAPDGPPAARQRYIAGAADTCDGIRARAGFAASDRSRFETAVARLSGLPAACTVAAGDVVCIPAVADLALATSLTRDDACLSGG